MQITIDEDWVHDLIDLLQDISTYQAAVIEDRLIEVAESQGLSLFHDGKKNPLWLSKQVDWAQTCQRHRDQLAKEQEKLKREKPWLA